MGSDEAAGRPSGPHSGPCGYHMGPGGSVSQSYIDTTQSSDLWRLAGSHRAKIGVLTETQRNPTSADMARRARRVLTDDSMDPYGHMSTHETFGYSVDGTVQIAWPKVTCSTYCTSGHIC